MPLDTDFLDSLSRIVGPKHLRRENQVAMIDPGVDEANLAAGLAVRPGSVAEVAAILALCNQVGVPVVTHGGRTGLAKGAVSMPGQIVLLTDRFDTLEIAPLERVALVGAGVTLQRLQEEAARHGLSPGIDIAARGSATIGGMVSTNAGGMEAFRYGMMRQRLLGMEAVLADGTIVADLARVPKNNEGYDLSQLFCGAEGTLGVVTRVTMRLERADPPSSTLFIGTADANAALVAMRALQDAGGLLRAEIMWRSWARIVARASGLLSVLDFCDAPVYALFETAGDEEHILAALEPLIGDGTVVDALMAQSEREAADFWRVREDSFAANREIAHPLWYDISLPLTGLDAYVAGLEARVAAIDPGLAVYTLGHLADGNLHVTIGCLEAPSDDLHRRISMAVEEGVKAQGGSLSAEHGIGTAKLATLARNAGAGRLGLMRRLKAALDPNEILNPGKVVPPAAKA